ncbi:hypothetical protein OB955_18375 [Halobacteria archaeon AArc-m2/3/4]|uniref:Uncharacterized protein n=1 Tax=Natronoglomus mannanivorans TaxID=2979990 RepID=A0ABT2QIB7_9EURY|nr:hypothetical protein [Halobacteria archaeon AArc-m2/3/4]
MSGRAPTFLRYTIAGAVVLWVALSQLGVLAFGYGILASVVPGVPTLTLEMLVGFVASPVFVVALGVSFAVSAVIGRARYGSLAAFSVAATKRVDDLFGYSLFDEPLVEGRIRHDEVSWRCRYWDDDRVEVVRRECPFCGLELIESFLPHHVVFGANTAFDPGEQVRETADEAWTDVFGEETAEDRTETLALSCPQCNFSIPGEKDVMEGQDGARATFRGHVERMKSGNARGNPFEEYAVAARRAASDDPTSGDLWDAYVGRQSDPTLLRIGVQPASGSTSASASPSSTSPSPDRDADGTERPSSNAVAARGVPDRDRDQDRNADTESDRNRDDTQDRNRGQNVRRRDPAHTPETATRGGE